MRLNPSRHALFYVEVNHLDFKRYVVHDYLIGKPIFIDRLEKTISFYDYNIHGQIFNLKNPEHHVIGAARINGLIRRTNGLNYNFTNSFSGDGYIYTYIMSPEQQAKCGRKPDIPGWNKLIVQTDDYAEAVKTMCEWVYEHTFTADMGDKDAERDRLLKYCRDFLSGRQDTPPTQEPTETPQRHDREER